MPQPDIFLALSESGFKIDSSATYGSTDARCPGTIEVLGIKHEIEQLGSDGGGKPRSVEAVHHGEMKILKRVDAHSPKLFRFCSIGEFITEAKLICYSSYGGCAAWSSSGFSLPQPYVQYVMTYVHIASIELEAESEDMPKEWIGLKYGQMKVQFTEGAIDPNDGHSGDVTETWSNVMEIPVAITSGPGSANSPKTKYTPSNPPAWQSTGATAAGGGE